MLVLLVVIRAFAVQQAMLLPISHETSSAAREPPAPDRTLKIRFQLDEIRSSARAREYMVY